MTFKRLQALQSEATAFICRLQPGEEGGFERCLGRYRAVLVSWGDGAQLSSCLVLTVLRQGFGKLVGSMAPGASEPGMHVAAGQRVLSPLLGYSGGPSGICSLEHPLARFSSPCKKWRQGWGAPLVSCRFVSRRVALNTSHKRISFSWTRKYDLLLRC